MSGHRRDAYKIAGKRDPRGPQNSHVSMTIRFPFFVVGFDPNHGCPVTGGMNVITGKRNTHTHTHTAISCIHHRWIHVSLHCGRWIQPKWGVSGHFFNHGRKDEDPKVHNKGRWSSRAQRLGPTTLLCPWAIKKSGR
jgi:hypothetical protein